MFSKWFGSKKQDEAGTESADLSFLATDMHSHFIPGIDDGAQTIDDSLALIKAMQALGYKSIVTTPHINFDHYPNTSEKILNGLILVQAALKENNIDIPIKAAAEYYIDDYFMQLLEREPLLPITEKQVLVEFSFASKPMQLNDVLFKMQLKGYTPIIAHPERYLFFLDTPDVYQELKDRGCLLQMNMLSLAGYYGNEVKQVAEKLLNSKLYDYCGTDMHHIKHAELVQKFSQTKPFAKLRSYPFINSKIVNKD